MSILNRSVLWIGLAVIIAVFPGRSSAAPIKLNAGYPTASNGNLHNFSRNATHGGVQANDIADPDSTRICVFCHTPHGAFPESTLWNRKAPAGPFPLYGRQADIVIDDIPADSQYDTTNYPNGATQMCLSCHDGVSAIGALFNGDTITTNYNSINDWVAGPGPISNNPVIDLSKTHPVSFVYSETVRAAIESAKPGKYTLPSSNILDGQDRMQCTACHDPHLDTRDRVSATYSLPFWRKYTGNDTNDYENTCLECHVGGSSGTIGKPGIGGNHNL